MQAVILAAGESSRFWPFNNSHKSLVKIMGRPIISYTIQGLINAGINDIIIIQGPNKDIERELKNYSEYSKNIKYAVQSEPDGMGNALMQAKDLLTERFLLVLAERVDCGEIIKKLNSDAIFTSSGTVFVGAKTDTPSLFGILKLENNKVIDIVEKPKKNEEPSNIKVLGIYVLTPDFFDVYRETKRHQYDFEEALSLFVKKHDVGLMLWDKKSPSLKYPWHLFEMRDYLFNKYLKSSIGKNTKIAESAEIIGDVSVGNNVSIMEKTVIKGPCHIGNNVLIGNNAILRGRVNIESDCVIGANMEVKNSLIMQGSTTHSGFIGDSIIADKCKIAAQFCVGNVRLDRGIIKSVVKGTEVETGYKYLGTFVGSETAIGIKVSTMPGVIVGRNVTIGPSTVVMRNILNDIKYYTKFQEIISKKNALRQAQDLQKPVVIFDIDYTLFDTDFFKESKLSKHKIYEEVIGVLKNLKKIATLGIFSEGNLDFQKEKLEKTGIRKYFEQNNTHIVLNKPDELKNVFKRYKDAKTFFVDDKLGILSDAKKMFPKVFVVWVKRGFYANSQRKITGFKPDAEVENLSEIARIVGLRIKD